MTPFMFTMVFVLKIYFTKVKGQVVVLKIYFTKVKSQERLYLLELLYFELNIRPITNSDFNFMMKTNSFLV